MEYFAKSIEAVMKKAKVKEAVLVGHSMGTPVIRQFYRLYPKKTLGLVIVDGSLRTGTKEEIEQFILPFRTNYKENSVQFVDGMLEPVQDKKLKQKIRLAMLAVPDYVGLSALEGMIDEKIWTNDQINAPVLAILAKSSWWKADEKDFFKSVAPNIDFQMWEGLSHFLMMEKPKEFNREVKAFIVKNKLL
jgi:pimeloyl-ACP methyl ester carboxylesterase